MTMQMSDALALVPIAGTVLLGMISPGPNFLLVTTTAVRSRAAAVAVAAGFALAALTWSAASIAGIAVLMTRLGWLYRLVKVSGGCYLIYIGARMIMRRANHGDRLQAGQALPGRLMLARRGFLANLANPKSAAFYGSVFATLVPHDATVLFLAEAVGVTGAVSLAWYALVGVLFSMPRIQHAYARMESVVDRATGTLLSVLGLAMLSKA
jgi:threonine efflux protein